MALLATTNQGKVVMRMITLVVMGFVVAIMMSASSAAETKKIYVGEAKYGQVEYVVLRTVP